MLQMQVHITPKQEAACKAEEVLTSTVENTQAVGLEAERLIGASCERQVALLEQKILASESAQEIETFFRIIFQVRKQHIEVVLSMNARQENEQRIAEQIQQDKRRTEEQIQQEHLARERRTIGVCIALMCWLPGIVLIGFALLQDKIILAAAGIPLVIAGASITFAKVR